MKPVIAIVGCPNVGKSTLYNRLTRSRDAIVSDQPGVTRDRIHGVGRYGDRSYWVVDTGGLNRGKEELQQLLAEQVEMAIAESDAVIFVVDGRAGPSAADHEIADHLRRTPRRVYLAVNKAEGLAKDLAVSEFHSLGVGDPHAISALRGDGVGALIDTILNEVVGSGQEVLPSGVPHMAVVGRPNVGKSTLVNALLGQPRMLVYDRPGTTRDSVAVPFRYDQKDYVLIDTAGLRRRAKITEELEQFALLRTLRTIERVHVVMFMVDAQTGITEQDARLAGTILDGGRAMVVLVNKWDGRTPHERAQIRRQIDRKLPFLEGVTKLFISAKHGSGLGAVVPAVQEAFDSAMTSMGTAELNQILRRAVEEVPPPMVGFRRIKLKYAHQGGKNPPLVVVHGNLVRSIPESYRRYLAKRVRKAFNLTGTPVEISFRSSRNPYSRKDH